MLVVPVSRSHVVSKTIGTAVRLAGSGRVAAGTEVPNVPWHARRRAGLLFLVVLLVLVVLVVDGAMKRSGEETAAEHGRLRWELRQVGGAFKLRKGCRDWPQWAFRLLFCAHIKRTSCEHENTAHFHCLPSLHLTFLSPSLSGSYF